MEQEPVYQIEKFCSDEDCQYLADLYKENEDKSFLYRNTFPIDTSQIPYNKTLLDTIQKSKQFASQIYGVDLVISNSELVMWPEESFMLAHYDYKNDRVASILYLNDDYEGGETVFPNIDISPEKGVSLFFDGSVIEHSVQRITKGTRYTLSIWYNLVNGEG